MRRFVFALALLLAASPALAQCPPWHPDEGVFETDDRLACERDQRTRLRIDRDFAGEEAARQRQESLELQREQLRLQEEQLRLQREWQIQQGLRQIWRSPKPVPFPREPVTCTRVDARTVICQ